ncbi:L7Ae/L30e/S12e/Gadd45 family ribosomal protein [Ruminococcus sp.]|uniref:L7Ae/L30e/S12e/Gadd45 family ribosomal protein n=1 Tax=Ruminococcus sp. TaxID=41978 RepID=UPI00388DB2CB
MNNDRLLRFLGICKRAGALVSGAETVEKTIREGKARLVLYASDVSENSLKRVLATAQAQHIPARRLSCDKDALSFALGRYCGIICTTDTGFAKKILEMME